MRKLAPAFLSLLTVLVFAQAASASSVGGTPALVFQAGAGETNNVVITSPSMGTIEITDTNNMTVTSPCSYTDGTGTDKTDVTCDISSVTSFTGNLGDGDDMFDSTAVSASGTVNGEDGVDDIRTGGGNDTLNGGNGADTLDGGDGADHVNGQGGTDDIRDSAGSGDVIDGGSEDDYITIGDTADGADTYSGGTGNDSIDYGLRMNDLTVKLDGTAASGESGENDTINSDVENATGSGTAPTQFTGNASNNNLQGGSAGDSFNGLGGDDYLWGSGGSDTFNGGDGVDDLEGGTGNDIMNGDAGNDTIYGDEGSDTIDGGADSDHIRGDDGADTIQGGPGDDVIVPGTADGGGPDGNDVVDGGDGVDQVDYRARTEAVRIDISGGSTPTTGNGQSGESDSLANFENIRGGGGGGDLLIGNDGPNVIDDFEGLPGDTVQGRGGDDTIDIYDGAVDTADCGDGNDTIEADAVALGDPVNDVLTACEIVNSAPVGGGGGGGGGGTNTGTNTTQTQTPVTVVTPLPIVNGAFFAKLQPSPKRDAVTGSVTVASDNSAVTALLLYAGKLAKVNVVGKTVKTGVKKGGLLITVKLNKKAAKALKKKKTLAVTLKVTIKPPSGTAFVKSLKLTMKKGKAPACLRASARAHAAC